MCLTYFQAISFFTKNLHIIIDFEEKVHTNPFNNMYENEHKTNIYLIQDRYL